jgi:anti-anti-sigma factor
MKRDIGEQAGKKLDIEVYPPVNGNQYITLAGRLDTHSHAALDELLTPLLAARPQALVLDLAHLEYISSAGVRCILKARKSLAPHEGKLLIVHPQTQIQKVIELAQAVPMDDIFETTADADAYLDAMQRRILDGEPEQQPPQAPL